jgi:hypothetical protein
MNHDMPNVLRAAEVDTEVSPTFHQAVSLTSRPERLFALRVLRRVLSPHWERQPGAGVGAGCVQACNASRASWTSALVEYT